ncbi:unnamed protein product [Polarella glacialis]|uniref:Uncharacterized protein n=1 Tax=Polarella glacialis TaxID=89957 RepID=A0A813JQV7_POLGL|nr:unnamed protein product [Polarella glacialis]CAE8682510.1 unnamed protein product [Polarella glacialis]
MPRDEDVSDDELSETTRAVRRIQRELEGGGDHRKAGSSRGGSSGKRRRGDDEEEEEEEYGRDRGAVTGIKLGEYAPGAKKTSAPSSGSFQVRGGRGGKDQKLGQSLESLAYARDDDEEAAAAPEAPAGSFRRRDLEHKVAGGEKAQLGIDGKVWGFIELPPSDEEGDRDEKKQKEEEASGKKSKKASGKGEKKSKKDKKTKKVKKKKKDKAKKKKKKSSSSSSESSSS